MLSSTVYFKLVEIIDGKRAEKLQKWSENRLKVTRISTASRLQMVWKSHNFWHNEGIKVYLDP